MYKIITIISSGIFFGTAMIYFYKKFNNTTDTFFHVNHNSNTNDTSNILIHEYIINAINNKNDKNHKNHKYTQTENNIDYPDLSKSTQIDHNSILNELEKVIEKTPEKYKWYFI